MTRTDKSVMVGYAAIWLLSAIWFDAMERAYILPRNQGNIISSMLVAILWPISLPLSLAGIAEKHSRWNVH